ncbi:MAG: dephospho-CoA kinase [Longicatena sp.]
MSKKEMKTIGLTGIMGAGKSSVIAILEKHSITVLDADKINANLLCKGNAGYVKLVSVFGKELLDGDANIDKTLMSTIIFQDEQSRLLAEGILHPLIKEEIRKEIEKHKDEKLVVVEVPLLFECKWEAFFDEVWVVACDEDILLERLKQYRKIDEKVARARIAHQIPQCEKIKKADVVFYNNSDKENLKRQIYDILKVNF